MSEVEEKSNRPKDTPLYQQRLAAWKPLMTLTDAASFFFVAGIVLVGIGLAIFIPDRNVVEVSIDYTNCTNGIPDSYCAYGNTTCVCTLPLVIPHNITGAVYFYYGMINYYQNHRKLSSSVDVSYLMGYPIPSSSCSPLVNNSKGLYYAPCGALPNVIFNDTFSLINSDINATVPWTSVNTSLPSDRNKFALITNWNNTVKPPNWRKTAYQRNPHSYQADDELLVWMRASALPTFKKLYRTLVKNDKFSNGLMAGNYTLTVNYFYPVSSFGGGKFFVISNLSWIGGRNPALGLLYIVAGCVKFVVGVILFFMSIRHPQPRTKSKNDRVSSKM